MSSTAIQKSHDSFCLVQWKESEEYILKLTILVLPFSSSKGWLMCEMKCSYLHKFDIENLSMSLSDRATTICMHLGFDVCSKFVIINPVI